MTIAMGSGLFQRAASRLRRLLAVAVVPALLVLGYTPAQGLTPLQTVELSPDITVVLDAQTVDDVDVASQTLSDGTVSFILVGVSPAGVDVDGYHRKDDGDLLLSFDTAVILTGAAGDILAQPGDVVSYDADDTLKYSFVFRASDVGLPDGVNVDAVGMIEAGQGGDLVLSFDIAVDLPQLGGPPVAVVAAPADLVCFDAGTPSLGICFEGLAEGVPTGLNLDAVHYLDIQQWLLSFDGSGTVDGVSFDDEDVLEVTRMPGATPAIWELAYDGSAEESGWPPADLDALYAVPQPSTPTATATATATGTHTVTSTATSTATETSTSTATVTGTRTPTPTRTGTATATATGTLPSTSTPTGTITATLTATATTTSTATFTHTDTATFIPTETPTVTPSSSSTPSATRTGTPTDTITPGGPTLTVTGTATHTATTAPTQTITVTAAATRTATATMPTTASPTITRTTTPTLPVAADTSTATISVESPTPIICVGDCDGSGTVSINELILGVNIALGNQPIDMCSAFDHDGNRKISINELVLGVNSALTGCG